MSLAEADPVFDIDVPSQDVSEALEQLATQTGLFLLVPYDLVTDIQSVPVRGRLSVTDALSAMLAGTPLSGAVTQGSVIVLSQRAGATPADESAQPQSEESFATVVGQLLNDSPEGRRDEDAQRSATFIDEVIATGSRIGRTNLTSPSQVTVLTHEDIEARGVVRLEDLLITLPQALAARTSSSGIDSATSTVNLRGLGAERTLVLLDGKRTGYGSPTAVATDLNRFPARLVERIEILTGGATAVYGADAIAGVVNIVPKRNFQGVEAYLHGGVFQADNDNSFISSLLAEANQGDPGSAVDGGTLNAGALFGSSIFNGNGNITGHFDISRDKGVLWTDRDISACPLSLDTTDQLLHCRGSDARPTLTRFTRSGGQDGFDLVVDPETQSFRDFESSTDAFNFASGNYLRRPSEHLSFRLSGTYELNTSATAYADLALSRSETVAQIAPSGLSTGQSSSINCDNPFLSLEQLNTFCSPSAVFYDDEGIARAPLLIGRRNTEGGNRSNTAEANNFRLVGGIRGQFANELKFDLFGIHSVVDFKEVLTNEVLLERVLLSLDAVSDPDTGQAVCRSSLTENNGCIPWNVFTESGVTPEAAHFLTVPNRLYGSTHLSSVGGSISGTLRDFGINTSLEGQAVLGAEFRENKLSLTTEPNASTTLLRYPVSGAVSVAEIFGELQLPLLVSDSDGDILTMHAAYRLSNYNTTGIEHTNSLGFTWKLTRDFRLRAQHQRATRSPNPIELFSPPSAGRYLLSLGANGLHDPCAGDFDPTTATPEPARTLVECARTGVTAEQYGQILDSSTSEFDSLVGGNVNLSSEKSDTTTFGIMWAPPTEPTVLVTIDYFSIDVRDFIDAVSPESTLISCLDQASSTFCDLISRDSTGSLWVIEEEAFIRSPRMNTGGLSTSGVDVSASVAFPVGLSQTAEVRYLATFSNEFDKQLDVGRPSTNCAGYFGGVCGTPLPDYRHRLSLNWHYGDRLSAAATWRHVSPVRQHAMTPAEGNQTLDRNNVFDLSLDVSLRSALKFRLGVNNILDQDPPLTTNAGFGGDENEGRGNTYPQLYDVHGRFVFASLTATLN